MGMAASQVRLLQLTSRDNELGRKLNKLSADKMRLTRDMRNVSLDYQASNSAKKLMWNTGGANYVDLTYANLMTPSSTNGFKPYMISDTAGKIVVDQKYKRYAEMISPNGGPGDWEAVRGDVIAELTGLSGDDIEAAQAFYGEYLDNKEWLAELKDSEPSKKRFTVQANGTKKLFERLGSLGGISNWADAYGDSSKKISKSNFGTVANEMKNRLGKYFLEYQDEFEKACDNLLEAIDGNEAYNSGITVTELIDKFVGMCEIAGVQFTDDSRYLDPRTGNPQILWYDVDTPEYAQYKINHDKWEANVEEAEEGIADALESYNALFNAENRNLIKFYDNLFSTIADKGWVYYEEADDPDYLNQMLQNGLFNITTKNADPSGDGLVSNEIYSTDIALNFTKIAQVRDQEKSDNAMVEYEALKTQIQNKEKAIDTQMQKYETERSAIQQMLQSIQNVMKSNIESNFNLFS